MTDEAAQPFGQEDPIFQTQNYSIGSILRYAYDGEWALPDFQRDFRWEQSKVIALLGSIISRFPAGVLLTLSGGQGQVFEARSIEGAPSVDPETFAGTLILDGQQRVTSLYQALTGQGDEQYALMLEDLFSGSVNLDSTWLPHEGLIRSGKPGAPSFKTDDPQWCADQWALPLRVLPAPGAALKWLEEALELRGESAEDRRELRARFALIQEVVLNPLLSYNFPVVALPASTSLLAVCTIFETLNTTGVQLTVFELITARLFADQLKLRELWQNALVEHPVISALEVDSYGVLQSLTLRNANSAQRSKVLQLDADAVNKYWTSVIDGTDSAYSFVRDECGAIAAKYLPYSTVMVPIAAVWHLIDQLKGAAKGPAYGRLKQFFWSTVFTSNYDQGGNSQAQADYLRLKDWLIDPDAPEPEAVSDFAFSAQELLGSTVRKKALYRGLLAMTLSRNARDFHDNKKINVGALSELNIESHHLFPKAYLKENYGQGLSDPSSSELLLNRALIDAATNKLISSRAPSEYLAEVRDHLGPEVLSDVLASHLVNEDAQECLFIDDYDGFLRARANGVAEAISELTGRPVDLLA